MAPLPLYWAGATFGALVLTAALAGAPLHLASSDALPVVISTSSSPTDRFAASELARYLGQIAGQSVSVIEASEGAPIRGLLVGRTFALDFGIDVDAPDLPEDTVRLKRLGERILLAGSGPRGSLDAVYVFLERLGCRWFAPNFAYYGPAGGEHIPHLGDPAVDTLDVTERPSFHWRKEYIEEGETHDLPTLLAMVDWMAKVRLNVLDCPIDYQGHGHTRWDNWRAALVPELRRRGILIEVGGHGYQNFMPASRYFAAHPDWFGMYKGKHTDDLRVVFSTANPDAMKAFLRNIVDYLQAHPEIDIFDCWPPDSARWSEAPADVALGTPTERQMILLDQVSSELHQKLPRVGLQFIAYANYVEPPKVHRPEPGVQMEFCPINRSFQSRLFDPQSPANVGYYRNLTTWLDGVMDPGSVSIYTYITKYAWRTLPILVPHLIADEARHFAAMHLGGFSSYSEPGGWAALELDHYFLARYSWNAGLDADRELANYAAGRYGPAAAPALAYLRLAEQVVPNASAIPGTKLKIDSEKEYLAQFREAAPLLDSARRLAAGDAPALATLEKLEGSRRYALNEIELRLAYLEEGAQSQSARVLALLAERGAIFDQNRRAGLLVSDQRTR